jgi:hypothetical protein
MEVRAMAQREKLSVGPVRAEGPLTSLTLTLGGIGLIALGFFTGQWTALINACFGWKF